MNDMTVGMVRAAFDEVIQSAGHSPVPRFGQFAREDVAVLFAEIGRLTEENKELRECAGVAQMMARR